jgi:hypothetical protein
VNSPFDPDFRVLALLFLVRLRATSYSTGMDEIEAALLNAKPDYQRMVTFLKALHQEHPAIAEEILTQTRELDFSDSHALDRFHTIFAGIFPATPRVDTSGRGDVTSHSTSRL